MNLPPPTASGEPSLRHHRLAAALVALLLCLLGALTIPFGRLPLPASISFMPAFGALTAFSDLLTAVLLLSQAGIRRDRPSACLGTAYLLSVLTIIPHLMAFPGAVAQAGLVGTSASAVWLWCIWHAAFALCVAAYSLTDPARPLRSIPRLVAAPVIGTLFLSALALWGSDLLPTILVQGRFDRLNSLGIGPFVVACSVAALILVLVRLRGRSVLAVWLGVATLAATIDVVLTLFGGSRFTVAWYAARCLSLGTGITVLVAMLWELMHLFRRTEETNRQLRILSLTDALTEVPNRRCFDETLKIEWRRAARAQTAVSLLMIDIDHFKSFNDHYGHPAGDACLRLVAQAISDARRRAGDVVGRVGGEEFAVLLPVIDEAGAAEVAQRIHAGIAALAIVHEASPLGRVSVSLGWVTRTPVPGQDSADLVAAADLALYRAKALGRNRSEPDDGGRPAPVCLRPLTAAASV